MAPLGKIKKNALAAPPGKNPSDAHVCQQYVAKIRCYVKFGLCGKVSRVGLNECEAPGKAVIARSPKRLA